LHLGAEHLRFGTSLSHLGAGRVRIKNIQAGATPQNTLTKKIGEVGEHSGDGLPLLF